MHPLGFTIHVVVEGRLQLLRDQTCGKTPAGVELTQGILQFETARTNACYELHIEVWEMCMEDPELTTTPFLKYAPPGNPACA